MSHEAQQPGDSQFHREVSGTDSQTPSDPFISNILVHLGLGNRHLPRATSLSSLLSELHNPDWRVRAAAARRLGKLGSKVPLEPLATILADDASSAVKAAAARALGELADFAPVEPLLVALDDSLDEVKVAAAWALGELGERIPKSTPLVNLLNCNNAAIRAAAIGALGELGTRTPTHILTVALGDADWQVREIATLALERQRMLIIRGELEPGTEGGT